MKKKITSPSAIIRSNMAWPSLPNNLNADLAPGIVHLLSRRGYQSIQHHRVGFSRVVEGKELHACESVRVLLQTIITSTSHHHF